MKKVFLSRIILFVILSAYALAVTGCNTLEGAGEDVEDAGEEVQDAAN